MKHIYVTEYGSFLGLEGNLCVVKTKDGIVTSLPLSRIKSINIHKSASISSDLVLHCAERGIQVHFIAWNGRSTASINGMHTHAIVSLRKAQLFYVSENEKACNLSKLFIGGKIANQRIVLQYFSKYHKTECLFECIEFLKQSLTKLDNIKPKDFHDNKWRDEILGIEGAASVYYWRALRESNLLPKSFISRDGRGSIEIVNKALNYGYAILQSRVWNIITNAGLEPFAGVLHTDRPGKPSLVLDVMEIYRSWIIDRNIIKLRSELESSSDLTIGLKKQIINSISKTLSSKICYKHKKLRLEALMQRQAYVLAGAFTGNSKYKPIRFKW